MRRLKEADPEVWWAIRGEMRRQQEHLELIASENYASPMVLAAQGSALTNKYAEGLPERRYYGGCEWVDQAEQLAIDRAKQLFGAEHANVQAHCGSQANMAVYFTVLQPGDTILCMNLSHGGHLTHGAKVNFSGRLYRVISYGVDPQTERLDYGAIRELARESNPDLIVAGASAYPRQIDFGAFGEIADEVGVPLMVDMAHVAGLVAARLHPDPVPAAAFVTSTTHKTLRGPRGGFILCRQEYAAKLDYNVFPGIQGGPLMHIIAAKAVAFGEALEPSFRQYQKQVLANAQVLAECLTEAGWRLVTGGTDNHLLLVDVSVKGLTGQQAERALQAAGITVNKNLIPFDPRKAQETSGIRLGTPAVTTRGMKEPQMRAIGALMARVLAHPDDEKLQVKVRAEVKELCSQFPVPLPEWADGSPAGSSSAGAE